MRIRRTLEAVSLAAACVALPLSQSHAQVTLGVGGGVSFPTGNLSNAYTTGFNALASLGIGTMSWPVGLRIDGMFDQMSHKSGIPIGNFQIWTLNADLVYNLMHGTTFTPYIVAGAGYYNDSYRIGVSSGGGIGAGGNTHANDFGLNGGVGVRAGAPSLSVFLEGRFHYVFTSGNHLDFIPITAGITF